MARLVAYISSRRRARTVLDNQASSELDCVLPPSTAAILKGHQPVYQQPSRRGVFERLGNLFRERRLRRQRRHWTH